MFLKSVVLGFSIAAPVGPIGLLCALGCWALFEFLKNVL